MIENIFILHHTHVDFGYTGARDQVCDELVGMVDQVTDLVNSSDDRPDPARFRWVHEVSWPVLEYLRRGGERRHELFDQIRAGRVELTAMYVNPTDLLDREMFEVSTDFACRLAREHDLPLDTAMFCDCPGIAWSIPDILAERDITYLSTAPDFIMSMPLEVPRPFWWEGPDGGRVLTWFTDWQALWYAEGLWLKLHKDPVEATRNMLDRLQKLEQEGYPWRAVAIHHALDNRPPEPVLMDFVTHFNGAQTDVQASLALHRDFFRFMETAHGPEFETHRGAWPDWWANGNASAAYEVACSRRAKASLRRSAAVAERIGAKRDARRVSSAVEDLLMFDEHTWGHEQSVSAPWLAQARLAWTQKRVLAPRALVQAQEMENELAARVGAPGELALLSPFDYPWTGVVSLRPTGKTRATPALRNTRTGELVPGQRSRMCLGRGSDTTGAEDSYVLSLAPGETVSLAQAEDGTADSAPFEALESPYFRIEYDFRTGGVDGVFDKLRQRPICDPDAEWAFAELIHERVRRGGREAMYDVSRGTMNPAAKRPRPDFLRVSGHAGQRTVRLETGPVYNALVTGGRLPAARFVRELRVYHEIPRIDVKLLIDKQVNTRYESLYLSFPYAANGSPSIWVENAGAVYRAGEDQLPGSATDCLSVGDYVAVEADTHTILTVPHDAPVVQTGDINTGKWAPRLSVHNGHIYSWVMNNMWFTNFPTAQEGVVDLRWSIFVQPGGFEPAEAKRISDSARVGVIASRLAAPAWP